MIPYNVIRSNRKTIALQINENAEIIVRAPHHVSQKRIHQFIEEKEAWISKTQQKMLARQEEIEQNSEFKDGKEILFLGIGYKVKLVHNTRAITIHDTVFEFPADLIEHAPEVLPHWYKRMAYKIIPPKVAYYAESLGLNYSKVGITSAKKRWGSCNSKGSINFSYRLIMTPPGIIDYVIVHELMHLREMNHSPRFWAHVESVIPDYKKRRKWLKDNQHKFMT